MGADYETSHEFSAGETISAEMFNELFIEIESLGKTISPDNLIGTWDLTQFMPYSGQPGNGTCRPSCDVTGTTDSTDSLSRYRKDTAVFSKSDNGSYAFSTNTYSPFVVSHMNSPESGVFSTIGDTFIFKNSEYGTYSYYYGKMKGEKRIVFSSLKSGSNTFNIIILDKLNLVPNPPSSLTYALPADNSSSSITLTWTDSQTEAVTGYKVKRKTAVTDNFTTVSTITDNTTRTYVDTNVTESGKYWYRVLAYNSNGDGVPSKVVKASFPDDEAPTGTLKIDNATTTTTSSSVTLNLTATDNKGVVGYLASESSAPPSTDSTSWVSITSTTSYSADVSFTLSSGYGVKFVYVWFKDGKGNIAGYGASITYSSQ